MTAALPEGWRSWPSPMKLALAGTLQNAAKASETPVNPWYCGDRSCSGEPHGPWTQVHARGPQHPPPAGWDVWLILAGRGFGKTRSGAEWAWRKAWASGPGSRGALVAPIAPDARDILVEGESGILAVAPEEKRPVYVPSKRRLEYPNGALQFLYSADKPDRLRGPQHHYAWIDEWAAMAKPQAIMDMLALGLRLGTHPELLVTTTPRALAALKALIAEPGTVVTGGSTYENLQNLAPTFKRAVLSRYEGTRLGRQELMAEILDDTPGALWSWAMLEQARGSVDDLPPLEAVTVALDPAVTSGEDSDESGIVVAGRAEGRFYVLADYTGRFSPDETAQRVVDAYRTHAADDVVVEVNNGGDYVKRMIAHVDRSVPVRTVHASRGKRVRAEPVAMLYEQGKVTHAGDLGLLEAQLTGWAPDMPSSPDRLDALVWAVTHLDRRPIPKARSVST